MIVVSGMLYRMKQNAVGLASIAILSTCVLVMISTTFSLYAGIEDTIKRQYPHQLSVHGSYEVSEDDYEPFPVEELASMVSQAAQEMDLGISYLDTQKYLSVTYLLEDGKFTMDRDYASDLSVMDKISICLFMTAEEYQEMTGTTLPLASGQVAVYSPSTNTQVMGPALVIDDMEFSNVVALDDYPIAMNTLSDASLVNNMYGIVVKDDAALEEIDRAQQEAYGGFASSVQYDVLVDFADQETEAAVDSELNDQVIELARAYADAQTGERLGIGLVWNSKADATEYYYGLNGTLLFLGLLLSIVFLFSTALIIYYKQISEGYEDRERFQIMEKVGMSAGEVKATIRSQILQVFFSPLLVAAVHILVAFPILSSFLKVLFLSSNRLFAGCMVVAFGMFLFIYVLIYKATAKVYYQIIHS
jgi:putative ABC transport system permease protein